MQERHIGPQLLWSPDKPSAPGPGTGSEREERPSDEVRTDRSREVRQLHELSIARLIASSQLGRGAITRDQYDQKIVELEEKSRRGERLFPKMTKEEFLEEGGKAFEKQKKWDAELNDQND